MSFKNIFLSVAFSITGSAFVLIVNAQGIKIGDNIPGFELGHVLNWNTNEVNITDYKGKLLILDFWGTGCTSCIKAFPEMDSLQKEFSDKIQIIAINKESYDSTRRFLSKHKKIKLPENIPFVTQDSILHGMFPHLSVPHHVWLDTIGTVRFITSGYNATRKNIEKYFAGELFSLREKADIKDFNRYVPMLAEGNGRWLDRAIFYSNLLHGITGTQAGGPRGPNHYKESSSIVDLLKYAFSENGAKFNFESPSTVILKVADPFKYNFPKAKEDKDYWIENYYYYYELRVPEDRSKDLYSIMQQDLKRYFNLDVRVEKRSMKCWVLTKVNPKMPITPEKNDTISNYYVYGCNLKEITNNLTIDIVRSNRNEKWLVINGTNEKDNKIMNFKVNAAPIGMDYNDIKPDLNRLKRDLRNLNLDLVEKLSFVDVLVIKERN